MKKTTALKIVNPILIILFLLQASSGILHDFVYSFFEIVHKPVGFALVVIAVIHVLLNWSWVKAAFFKKK